MNPDERARQSIDRLLTAAGWAVQDYKAADLTAARGVALREFELNPGHGTADYLLYVDGKAAGIVEAKKQGATLTGIEVQSGTHARSLPAHPARLAPAAALPVRKHRLGDALHQRAGPRAVPGAISASRRRIAAREPRGRA